MKKILLLTPIFLALCEMATAQQCPAIALPYVVTSEASAPATLPNCVYSSNVTFSSQEVFETLSGPVPGFDGDVLAFNTIIDTQWGMPADAPVGAGLYSRRLLLTAGTHTVSYRYGNSDAALTIDNLTVYLSASDVPDITIAAHENITGATATTFVSQPFTVPQEGEYTLWFDAWSTGTQGFLYLDDIKMVEGVMAIEPAGLAPAVSVYPNPANDVLTLTSATNINKVEIFSLTGQKVLSQNISDSTATINIQALAPGVYVLHAEAGSHIERLKIIKE
ncbi:MAG: T9SS type A sorting domain-containing protein [Bacteroidota bacterium]